MTFESSSAQSGMRAHCFAIGVHSRSVDVPATLTFECSWYTTSVCFSESFWKINVSFKFLAEKQRSRMEQHGAAHSRNTLIAGNLVGAISSY